MVLATQHHTFIPEFSCILSEMQLIRALKTDLYQRTGHEQQIFFPDLPTFADKAVVAALVIGVVSSSFIVVDCGFGARRGHLSTTHSRVVIHIQSLSNVALLYDRY